MTPRPLEKVLYFQSHIVTSVDKATIAARMDEFTRAVDEESEAIREERDIAIREYREESAEEIANGRIVEDYEDPEASRRFSSILNEKQIPHDLGIWGTDMKHDWPTWRMMLPFILEEKF
jgi:hypothetical protein